MFSPRPSGARRSLVRFLAEARRSGRDGLVVSGHHNTNRIARLRQPLAFLLGAESGKVLAKFRTPRPTVEVVPRIWRRESEVLRVVGAHLGEVPGCLADFGTWSLHEYLEGRVLADENPAEPVGGARLWELADFFARLAGVPVDELPPLPGDWPEEGDSLGFLSWLARFAEREVYQSNRSRFGGLFSAVGIPADAVDRFMGSVPGLTRRPFALLHTDVHRANVVVVPGPAGERLSVIDWELALYGDPLHDLATHLVRMNYDKTEQDRMTAMWTDAMRRAGHERMTAGLDEDLPVYLGFEYAQSVYPDVMRAALALPSHPGEEDFSHAAGCVAEALRRAREPLRLTEEVPDTRDVGAALRKWHAADTANQTEKSGAGREPGPGSGPRPDAGPGKGSRSGPPGTPAGPERARRTALGERMSCGRRLGRPDASDRMEPVGVGG